MRMRSVYIIALVLCANVVFGQYNADIGFSLGGANYLGEIGGKEKSRRGFIMDMKLQQTNFAFGAFGRYRLADKFYARIDVMYGQIEGADSLSTNRARRGRNLSFKNNILEIGLRGEYAFYTVYDLGGTGRYQSDLRMFIHGGIAYFHHNPTATLNGVTYNLQSLNTEQRTTPYKLHQVAIPLGAGFYYTVKQKHRIGFEFGWRKTFTDYLDDVSGTYADPDDFNDPSAEALSNRRSELGNNPDVADDIYYGIDPITGVHQKRGDATHNDSYMFSTLSYSYVLRGKNNFFRAKYNYVYGGKKRRRRTRAKF